MAFFAPAVLALVLQHMGVTLTALSMVRERLSGAMDIFRVAPVRALEIWSASTWRTRSSICRSRR